MIDDSQILIGHKDKFRLLVLEGGSNSLTIIQFEADGTYNKIWVPETLRLKLAEIINGE